MNQSDDKKAYILISVLSFLVLVFLFWLIYFNPGQDSQLSWVSYLPTVNATLNSITTFLLICGYIFIKQGLKKAHIISMLLATSTSGMFLVSYIIYHHYQGDTLFLTRGWIRPVYFFILISHIILSIALVPMVFSTLYHAARSQFDKHKRIARLTFPIWIYVSITGVLIYIFVHYLNHP
jgi:putative membrane protein